MNATLERVDELREYMVHEAVQEQTTEEELAVLSRCLSNVGDGEGALKVALQTLNETQGTERAELLKMMDAAASQLTACVDSLKKHARDDVVHKAMSLTQDSIQACSLAKDFLPALRRRDEGIDFGCRNGGGEEQSPHRVPCHFACCYVFKHPFSSSSSSSSSSSFKKG